jgi:kinesin family member 2/24
MEDVYDQPQEPKAMDSNKRVVEKEASSYNPSNELDKPPPNFTSNYTFNSRDESAVTSSGPEKEKFDMKNAFVGSTAQKMYSAQPSQNLANSEEKVQMVSPPRRRVYKDERTEKPGNWTRKDGVGSDLSTASHKQHNTNSSNTNNVGSRRYEPEPLPQEDSIKEILEVGCCTSRYSLYYAVI